MGYRTTKSKIKVESDKANNYTEFYYHFFRNILLVSIPLTIISALALSISHSSARISSSDSLAISVPSSCTLSSSVDEAHSASIVNGRYEEGIGTTTLSTFCNDKNGYSVYAIGDSLNSEGNNVLVSNINNNYDIPSGTATSGDTSNWAMKLALKAGDTSTTPPTIISPFDSYSTVPTTWTKVATVLSSTADMKEGSNFATTYATYISPTQAAGTYLGQVKYLLTHPSAAEPDTSYFIMQEVANWKNDLDEEESVQAIDIRDNKTYWVTKLKDGHVWMTQNLDFDITDNTRLSSDTTDLNEYNTMGYTVGYSNNNNIIYWYPASTSKTINFTGNTITGWQNSNTAPYSASKTDDINTGHASLGNYYNWTAAIASNDSSTFTSDTLNNISNNPKNSICPKGWRLPTISNEPTTISGSTNEFARLNYLYNNSSNAGAGLLLPPLWFVRAGRTNGSATYNIGTTGYYTSSTTSNSGNYYINFSNNNISLSTYAGDSKQHGMPIRCIAK